MICKNCGVEVNESQKFCPQCGSTVEENGQAIHSDIANHAKEKSSPYPKLILGIVLGLGIFYFFATINRSFHPVIAEQPSIGYAVSSTQNKIESTMISAHLDHDFIVVPVKDIVTDRIVRFKDPSGRQDVPILAYVTPRGKIVTAMSLSESCRSTDFYLEGSTIHCANCPSYWDMESLEAYACCQKYYPDPIPSKVENGLIKIKRNVVIQWKARL